MFDLGFPQDYTKTLEKGSFFIIKGNTRKFYLIKQYEDLFLAIGQKKALY